MGVWRAAGASEALAHALAVGPSETDGGPEDGGLRCRFGASDLVPATLVTDGGDGAQRLLCAAPPFDEPACAPVPLRVTNNADNPAGGNAISDDEVLFTYYDVELPRGRATAGTPPVKVPGTPGYSDR